MQLSEQERLLQLVSASLASGSTKIRTDHLDRYDRLRANLANSDVSVDAGFQKTYSGLFRLRFMAKTHRPIYYALMETSKVRGPLAFDQTLQTFHESTGRWEVSFICKLIALIDPSRPIWDSIVSRHLGLKLPIKRTWEACCEAYEQLETETGKLLEHQRFGEVVDSFNQRFPGRDYAPMRVLDVTVWGLG